MSADATPTNRLDPAEAPEGVPRKPKPEGFLRPVPWLFGRDYIAAFKSMLVYAAFKGKLDPRDWMKANVIPAPEEAADPDDYWRRWNEARGAGVDEAADEFWFDYLSDTGDGQRAVYSIAHLSMSDLVADGEPQVGDALTFSPRPDPAGGGRRLPRGAFLFVGGDTSYHISDYATLANRFQNPFCWAYRDLYRRGAASVMHALPRLLVGIPGNHDYYDSLDGFNRQFRRPAAGEAEGAGGAAGGGGGRPPQLRIPTFERVQEGSYLALRLPRGWWFWGLDTEGGEIDFRQWEFFDRLRSEHDPKRLVLATPEPTTVFGRRATRDDSQSKTFAALRLARPFLPDGEPLGPGRCRLDLSGDIHHYARHWGRPPGSHEPSNYASVVAGAGGAFFHPTHTTAGEVRPEAIYPAPAESRRRLADELFKLSNIVRGGYVWLFGAVIAFVVAFEATFTHGGREAVETLPLLAGLGASPAAPHGTVRDFLIRLVPVGASLVLLAGALVYASKLFRKVYDPEAWLRPAPAPKEEDRPARRVLLWALVAASFAALVFGMRGLRAGDEWVLTDFRRSVVVLCALVWAALALALSLKYSEWLFEEAHKADTNIKPWHYWPIWGLIILSVLGVGSALWFFGRHAAAVLVSDLVFLLVAAGVVGGLTFFAVSVGGGLKRGAGKLAFLLLGLSHGLLQLSVPFLLFRRGHLLWATLAALALVLVSPHVGRPLARMENGWPLALAWVVFGAALVAVPFVIDNTPSVFGAGPLNAPEGGWARLALCLYAAAVGAVMSCALFGWYLAVALAFDGHNNEAGGAARVEGFKQFIRFRIDADGLTGYVIGFDEPATDGGDGSLRPKVIDIFRVRET